MQRPLCREARSACLGVMILCALLLKPLGLWAHHGGLVVSEAEESQTRTLTWENEVQSNGYRIKFLSVPKEPERQKPIRLVFEVQRTADGIYQKGLTPRLTLRKGIRMIEIPAVETDGVIGYYEAKTSFPAQGALAIDFSAQGEKGKIEAKFTKATPGKPYAVLGGTVIGAVSLLTLFGGLSSIYSKRRIPAWRLS